MGNIGFKPRRFEAALDACAALGGSDGDNFATRMQLRDQGKNTFIELNLRFAGFVTVTISTVKAGEKPGIGPSCLRKQQLLRGLEAQPNDMACQLR